MNTRIIRKNRRRDLEEIRRVIAIIHINHQVKKKRRKKKKNILNKQSEQ